MDAVCIRERLDFINKKIREAERRAGRAENSVRLMAVSKFHPAEAVIEALNCGQFLFGENRVQEAMDKFPEVCRQFSQTELHIIGGLQSNKVKNAVRVASCVQSVDRIPLLPLMERFCADSGKKIRVLFELHTAEDTKSGFRSEDELRAALDGFAGGLYPHLIPAGFMTMAPLTDDQNAVRSSFIRARSIAEKLKSDYHGFDLSELSMGMSGDFEIAIEEGSTMVRIGTAIFGERDYQKK